MEQNPSGRRLPDVSLFVHQPDEATGRRQISISLVSLAHLILRHESIELQDYFASKSIASLPETFSAPTDLEDRFVSIARLPEIAKLLVGIFIDAEFDEVSSPSFLGRKISFLPFRELAQASHDLMAVIEIFQQVLADTAVEIGLCFHDPNVPRAINSRISLIGSRIPFQTTSTAAVPIASDTTTPVRSHVPQHHHYDREEKPPLDVSSCSPVVFNGTPYAALYPAITFVNGAEGTVADARRWLNRARVDLRPSEPLAEELPSGTQALPGQLPRTKYCSFSYLQRLLSDATALEAIIPKDRIASVEQRQSRWNQLSEYILSSTNTIDVASGPPDPKRRKLNETDTLDASSLDATASVQGLLDMIGNTEPLDSIVPTLGDDWNENSPFSL